MQTFLIHFMVNKIYIMLPRAQYRVQNIYINNIVLPDEHASHTKCTASSKLKYL